MKRLFILAIIILLFGVSEKVSAQQVYVVTYQLGNPAAKKADELKKFYRPGWTQRHDQSQRVIFEMKCYSDSTFLVYLPVYSEDGRRTDCCPMITLYQRHGKWRTDNMPADRFAYNKKESKSQAKIISRAVKFLSSKKFNPPT